MISKFETLLMEEVTRLHKEQRQVARNTIVSTATSTGLPVTMPKGIQAGSILMHAPPIIPSQQDAMDPLKDLMEACSLRGKMTNTGTQAGGLF